VLEFGNHYSLIAFFVFHLAYYSVVIAVAVFGDKCFVCSSLHVVTVLYLAVSRYDFVHFAEFDFGLRLGCRCFALLQFFNFNVSCTRTLLVVQMAYYFVAATKLNQKQILTKKEK